MCQVWCSGIQGISAWLGGQVAMVRYSLFYIYRSAKFCVVVFMVSLLEWGGQSVIHPCYTVTPPPPIDHRSMLHHYTFPSSIDHRSMLHYYTPELCPRYLCIMVYVKCMWCSGLPWIYSQLEEGGGVSLSWKWFCVVVCHGSMVNWRG